MAIFTPKTRWYSSDVNNPQYTTYNAYYGSPPHNNWMPNCVAWTFARWNQLSNVTSVGPWPTTAADLWYSYGVNMGLQHSTSFNPQVGACICYAATFPDPDHEHGHVCIIEQLHRPAPGQPVDYVWTSNSFYNSTDRTPQDAWPFFEMAKIYVNNPNTIICDDGIHVYGQSFQGILYHPNFPPGDTPVPVLDELTKIILAIGSRKNKKRPKRLIIRR